MGFWAVVMGLVILGLLGVLGFMLYCGCKFVRAVRRGMLGTPGVPGESHGMYQYDRISEDEGAWFARDR